MIFLSAGELWAAVIGLAAAMGAAWYLLGVAFRFAGRRWRKSQAVPAPPPSHPVWRNPRAPAAAAGPGAGPPLTAMPPTASQSMAAPMVPAPGVTLTVSPCGCIFYHRDTVREPCPGHRAAAADRAEINRLDQQIRNMP